MIKTKFKEIIKNKKIKHFLLDASGVLYNKPEGLIQGVKESICMIESLNKSFFLVTNNSMLCPSDISKYLNSQNLNFDPEKIISSGLGCFYDKKCREYIVNKNVFISGNTSSYFYAKESKKICDNINEAETIIFTSNPLDISEDYYTEICEFIRGKPSVNLICLNPDKYIFQNNDKKSVIGYWANHISKKTNREIYFFGKPYQNYFNMLKEILSKNFNILDMKECCYVDDWIDNLSGCKLNVKKVWAYKSGLGNFFKGNDTQKSSIDYIIDSIGN